MNEQMTEGEVRLCEYQCSMAGGFVTKLFDAIFHADTQNQRLLSLGFPEEVEAVQRFQGERGYWPDLQERFKGGSGECRHYRAYSVQDDGQLAVTHVVVKGGIVYSLSGSPLSYDGTTKELVEWPDTKVHSYENGSVLVSDTEVDVEPVGR